MQPFTLTRSDYVQAHQHATAHMRALAAQARKARAHTRPAWLRVAERPAKAAASCLLFMLCWVLFQAHGPGPRAMAYVLCVAAGAVAALVLAYAYGAATLRSQLGKQLSDDGCMLSPQSVAVGEDGIEQHARGIYARLEWPVFQARQEDEARFFLFYEPGICMVIPKAALSVQEQTLIAQRIPAPPPAPR